MARIGNNPKRGSKKATKKDKEQNIQLSINRRSPVFKGSKKKQIDAEDMPLDPNKQYEEASETEETSPTVSTQVEPFEDGIVSSKLQNLSIIPRIGGEEVALLHDFLYMFARTETFIGAISSKTSFMKNTGGRLL